MTDENSALPGEARPVLVPRMLPGHGVALAADVGGADGAPSVVLLPGAGQTRRAWEAVARRLVQLGYHVVSFDLRGHGGSEWSTDGDYSTDAFVADVHAALAPLAAPVVLIGASLGGIAALLATASGTGGKVAGLVLVDVVPDMQAEGLKRIRDFMSANTEGFASVEEAADAVAAYLPGRPRPSSSRGLANSLRSCADGRLRWHWDPAFHAGSRARSVGGMFERMATAAKDVIVPTLLISGRNSEVVSREGARKLLAVLPQADWLDVAGASHMVAGDSNAAFSAALEEFLGSALPLADAMSGAPGVRQ